MEDVLPEIVNDPDLIIETDEEDELLAPDVREVVREIDTDDVFERPKNNTATTKIVPIRTLPKPKRQLSESHKEKLKLAREKAIQVRRERAAEKKQFAELESKANEKQKVKKIKEMEDIVNDIPQPKPKVDIDESVIQKAIEEALTRQEMARQKRKQEKKAKQDEEIEYAKAQEVIRQAIYPPRLYMGDAGFASKYIYNFQ
jgi:hypothetical protein